MFSVRNTTKNNEKNTKETRKQHSRVKNLRQSQKMSKNILSCNFEKLKKIQDPD